MKKYYVGILSLLFLMLAFSSCDPVCSRISEGGIVDSTSLKLDVHATTDGGNQIVMINNTPKVGSYWNYGTGLSSAQNDTVVLPFIGEQTITFTSLCDGGTVTAKRKINIKQIDHPVSPEWTYFAGSISAGKTWVWDPTVNYVYGEGGYLTEQAPDWTLISQAQTDDPDGYMVFDLNGGPNFTKYKADGTVKEKGTFSFDMSSTKTDPDDNSQWSIGTLTLTGATVLSGHLVGSTDAQYKYDILVLNDNVMILCAAAAGTAAWDSGTFWLFRAKN
jgi:hypothetical protein